VRDEHDDEVILSIVVPVYNQEQSIADNVEVIRDRVRAGFGGRRVEIIVVSDGSIDRTEERLQDSPLEDVRVLHYDRNLGKGYAVKLGALEATGRWVGYVDADLDIDPASLPAFVAVAEGEELDFVVGSKRHPDSEVVYPRSRRFASWLFQVYVRLLLQLEVRDTQVGIKVFRRAVADEVMPLLIVKRYAFDIELLAVARTFGFDRIKEMPVKLTYQFTGSGVKASAVAHALTDALAIAYRLRVLRYYQRRRTLAGALGWTRPAGFRPLVSVVADTDLASSFDYPAAEAVASAADAHGDVLAFVEPGGRPAGNWLSATVPFLARDDIAAVVTPSVAPLTGNVRSRAAAAVRESRLGGGSQWFRFLPGNIRLVREFPGENVVVRRADWIAAGRPGRLSVLEALDRLGRAVVYTPESVVVASAPPLWLRHLASVTAGGRARGRAVRTRGIRSLRASSLVPVGFWLWVLVGWPVALLGPDPARAWGAVIVLYVVLLIAAGLLAALRFRSLHVGLLSIPAFAATHAAYALGFVRGLVRS